MERIIRTFAVAVVPVLLLGLAAPAFAQQAGGASASAYGLKVLGIIEDTPAVSAAIPPGESDAASDEVLEVPAEPAVQSFTASVTALAEADPTLEARLQEQVDAVDPDAPSQWNASGSAITEDLVALDGNLTAGLIAAEALASCVDGELSLASASEFQDVTLGGEAVPLEELEAITGPLGEGLREQLEPLFGETTLTILSDQPNDVVLDIPELGIRITAWETNWDGETGTTDGSETVWVNALRVELNRDSPFQDLWEGLEPLVGEDVDIVVSHAEASADCSAAAPGPVPGDPLDGVAKSASDATVAPGDTFTYTIVVPNGDDECTLTDVAVVDTITGPTGSEVTSTAPEADSVDGLTVAWDDVGPIGPGESVSLTIDVKVPDDAPDGAEYSETVAVTADCDGTPVQGGIEFDGPTVAVAPAAPAPAPALPRTGGGLLLAGLAALGGGAVLRHVRRNA